ncbi:hypothetical protein GCK32_003312 [Trichostrongylus colubriformis]|uniref:Uncharacterized protein n=1 Tax=Trichostrongylus colubriformis TaxID=6319 RepID=A0AAN8F5W3_TRICO
MNLSPLMGFLNPDSMSRMADLAVQLSSFAAQSMAKNEKDVASNMTLSDGLPDFGGIRDYVPGAKENFGIRKGPGCLPFLSEFMQVAYGNCQQVADEKTFDAWGDELKSAILTGKIDLLKARMTFLLYAFLTFTIVSSAPTTNPTDLPQTTGTTTTITTARITSAVSSTPVVAASVSTPVVATTPITVGSTDASNETDTVYTGLRGSIQKEIVFLRHSYETLRRDLDEWMSTPYHRNVVIPASIGVLSAFFAIVFYYAVRNTCRRCLRFRRARLSHLSCDLNGDKKRMLPRKDDSDDDL